MIKPLSEQENPNKPKVPDPTVEPLYKDSTVIVGTTLPMGEVTVRLTRDIHVNADAEGKFRIHSVIMPQGVSTFAMTVTHPDYSPNTVNIPVNELLASAPITCVTEDAMLGKFKGTAQPNSIVNVKASGPAGYEYDHDVTVGADGTWGFAKNVPFENGVLHLTSHLDHYIDAKYDHTIDLLDTNVAASNYFNNSTITVSHTRVYLPATEFFTGPGAVNVEADIMP